MLENKSHKSSIAGRDGLHLDLNRNFGTIKAPLKSLYPSNTLSIVMIVKDEAENIEAAVKSFLPLADEIIINDTGSTDGTQAILEKLPIRWFQTSWQGDFSLARNQSIEKARCCWLLWMDADDRIPADQVENFLKLKTAPLDRIFGFQVINTQGGQPLGARFMQYRMFPNHPELRFERKIHEQIVFSAARMGLHNFHTETTIHHVGYEDEKKKRAKALRNLKLAEDETGLIGKDPAFTNSLGDSYYILEEWDKGIEAYKLAFSIQDLKQINKDIYAILPSNIGNGYQKLGKFETAIEWHRKAQELSPDILEPFYYEGECLAALGREEQAIKRYRKVVEMPLVHSSIGNQYDAVRIFGFHHLSVLLMKKRMYRDAARALEKMHESYPQILETWDSLGQCYFFLGEHTKAVSAWKQCIDLNPGRLPDVYTKLLYLLEENNLPDDLHKYLEQAGQLVPGFSWSPKLGNISEKKSRSRINSSLCMIVKNEEKVLYNCLRSAAGLFDEIVVVDTGSTDKTMEIAGKFGAGVLQTKWENDFSRARNFSIDSAGGRWIMWLDADDVIPESQKRRISGLLNSPPEKAYGFMVKSSVDGGVTGNVFSQIRLFPNQKEIRFVSPVHEQVLPALEKAGIAVEYTDIIIIHTGYTDEAASRKKQIRNKDILEKQIRDGNHITPVTLYSYAYACMDLGDNESALEFFLQAVELAEKTGTDHHIIEAGPAKAATALANQKRFEEAKKLIQVGLNQACVHPETFLLKAQLEEATGNYEEAYAWYSKLLAIKAGPTFIPVDFELLKIKALEYMGKYWHRNRMDEISIILLKAGINIKKGIDFTFENLIAVHNEFNLPPLN